MLALANIFAAELRSLHGELQRSERRITELQRMLRTSQHVGREFAELFWDADEKRKQANEALKEWRVRCDCWWQRELAVGCPAAPRSVPSTDFCRPQ